VTNEKKCGKLIHGHTTVSCAQKLLSSQYKAWAKRHNLRLGSLFKIPSKSAKKLVTLNEDLEIRLHSSRPRVRLRLRTGIFPLKLSGYGKYWSRVAKHDTVILRLLLRHQVREIVVQSIAQSNELAVCASSFCFCLVHCSRLEMVSFGKSLSTRVAGSKRNYGFC
jgi:hypothetical protein